MNQDNIISAQNVSKQFNNTYALEDVSFEVKEGKIFGLLGPSGSGKTTTIKMLTNQLNTDSGEVYIFGKKARELTSKDFANIGIMSDNSGFYEHLSLYDNLKLFANILKAESNHLDDLLKEVGLYEDREKKAKDLSKGMTNRLLLIRALIAKPALLFLDEPTSSLDPNTTRKIHKLFKDVQKQGTTIFLTTHDMHEAKKMCDHLILLHQGSIIIQGSPKEIIHSMTKEVHTTITFLDGTDEKMNLEELNNFKFSDDISSIHTTEPTLEEVFVELTGEGLYD